ncbi:acyltransferase family protein [Barrientosiimonas endolithica]|uniref:Acyltransferase n=1 Tax=Barrientosiimonas endolithica TaxID=1535208 RepID=A0ABM8HB81_9MICO|nr:acyltransferase family protein [Barrientosiimonas endolithica]BDZ58209.1 acyltransferase [Barrientosiimonas endolithica]
MTSANEAAASSRRRYAALDGYRGLFVMLVVLYHFGATALVGGWIGINHFFLFSGFLITRLLIKEQQATGRIRVLGFYRRRGRRVLPALFVLVAAVLVHTAFWESERFRSIFGGDAFAALGFFLNWRLISRDDAYFDLFGNPSPLRHAWTLSVEEQFYVLIPFLVMGLCLLVKGRRGRFLLALSLAVASAVWTAVLGYDGPGDQARLYYGTDTRAQAILLGVAMAFLLSPDYRGRPAPLLSRPATEALAWTGLAISVGAIFVLTPTSSWVYNGGGMLLFAGGAALMGFSALDPRPLFINRLFGVAPLVFLGRISYGLYLYHWPIALWVSPPLPQPFLGALQLSIAVAVAAVSFRYLELPILRHGVRGVVRRAWAVRVVPAASFIVLALGATTLWTTSDASAVPNLRDDQPAYVQRGPELRVGLLGDSVGDSLVRGWRPEDYPGIRLDPLTAIGCDLIDAPYVRDGQQETPPAACEEWRRTWPQKLRSNGDEALLVLAGAQFLTAHAVPGGVAEPGTPAAGDLIRRTLSDIERRARESGARSVQVANLPCRRIDEQRLDPRLRSFAAQGSDDRLVGWANGVIADWAKGRPGVQLVDLAGQLCGSGYRPELQGIALYHDTVHFSDAGAAMVWTWLAPAVRDNARTASAPPDPAR